MTITEYLEQGRKLDQRIHYSLWKLKNLRKAACLPGSTWHTEDMVSTSRLEEAPFVGRLEQIDHMEEDINREIRQLTALKAQIAEVIRGAGRNDYQLVLAYRELEGMSWGQISDLMMCSVSTAQRWHRLALARLTLPENPIIIGA